MHTGTLVQALRRQRDSEWQIRYHHDTNLNLSTEAHAHQEHALYFVLFFSKKSIKYITLKYICTYICTDFYWKTKQKRINILICLQYTVFYIYITNYKYKIFIWIVFSCLLFTAFVLYCAKIKKIKQTNSWN